MVTFAVRRLVNELEVPPVGTVWASVPQWRVTDVKPVAFASL